VIPLLRYYVVDIFSLVPSTIFVKRFVLPLLPRAPERIARGRCKASKRTFFSRKRAIVYKLVGGSGFAPCTPCTLNKKTKGAFAPVAPPVPAPLLLHKIMIPTAQYTHYALVRLANAQKAWLTRVACPWLGACYALSYNVYKILRHYLSVCVIHTCMYCLQHSAYLVS